MSNQGVFAREKAETKRYRYVFNMTLVISVFALILLVIPVVALADRNEEKYLFLVYIWLAVMGVYIIVISVLGVAIAKREIREESEMLSKMIIDSNSIPPEEYCATDNFSNKVFYFDPKSFRCEEQEYPYEKYNIHVVPMSMFRRVRIHIEISEKSSGIISFSNQFDEKPLMRFELSASLLRVIKEYELEVLDKDIIDYIYSNPRNAAQEILKYGTIKSHFLGFRQMMKDQQKNL